MFKFLLHACLTAVLLAGVVSCRPESDPTEALDPAPALPKQAVKTPRFGISTPGANTHEFKVEAGKPLAIHGWMVADEPIEFSYQLNGTYGKVKPKSRKDVERSHASYKFAQGWEFSVPAEQLKSENVLHLYLGDKCVWTMTVDVK